MITPVRYNLCDFCTVKQYNTIQYDIRLGCNDLSAETDDHDKLVSFVTRTQTGHKFPLKFYPAKIQISRLAYLMSRRPCD